MHAFNTHKTCMLLSVKQPDPMIKNLKSIQYSLFCLFYAVTVKFSQGHQNWQKWLKVTRANHYQKFQCNCDSDGGGSFLACEAFGRMFDHSFPACVAFKIFFFWFRSLHTLIPLFMPGSVHSCSASWEGCGRMFPDKLHVSSFLDRLPHYAWTVA